MTDKRSPSVYDPVLKTLHWTIALAIIALLCIGGIMTSDLGFAPETRKALYAFHKSLGVLVLLPALARIFWRLGREVPAMPPGLKAWEAWAATWVHRLLYVMLVLQPLSGWTLNTVAQRKTPFFGLFIIPDLPFLSGLADVKGALPALADAHGVLAAILTGLLVLHVGAAIKHHFLVRDDVLLRMAPASLGGMLRALRGERRARP